MLVITLFLRRRNPKAKPADEARSIAEEVMPVGGQPTHRTSEYAKFGFDTSPSINYANAPSTAPSINYANALTTTPSIIYSQVPTNYGGVVYTVMPSHDAQV
jgi:hypothetical protein